MKRKSKSQTSDLVECPICGRSISGSEALIEKHISRCLRPKPVSTVTGDDMNDAEWEKMMNSTAFKTSNSDDNNSPHVVINETNEQRPETTRKFKYRRVRDKSNYKAGNTENCYSSRSQRSYSLVI